jgi:hypothetical protein
MIAIDDSEHSARALRYVGTLLRDTHDVQITLFHVLKPMPRELLEHGGSRIPQGRFAWPRSCSRIRRTGCVRKRDGYPILVQALECLERPDFLWIASR